MCRPRGRPRRSRCWARSITRSANSSSTPARPSAAAISSPISSNSTGSMAQNPGSPSHRWCWSRKRGRPHQQTRDGGAGHPRPLAHRRVAAQIRARTERHRDRLARPQAHHLAHQTFDDIDALDNAIHQAVDALNDERTAVPGLPRLRILQDLALPKPGESDAFFYLADWSTRLGERDGGLECRIWPPTDSGWSSIWR